MILARTISTILVQSRFRTPWSSPVEGGLIPRLRFLI